MKTQFKKLVVLFTALLLFIVFPTAISAQAQQSQRWVCLQVDWCLDQAAFNETPRRWVPNPICSTASQGNGHRVRLSSKTDAKPLPNKNLYIIECLATTNGEVCTSGNTAADNLIYGKDNTKVLNSTDKYEFQGIFQSDGLTATTNPQMSQANSSFGPVEWQSYSKGNERKFLGVNLIDPNDNNNFLGQGAIQQGTFSFDNQFNQSNCVSISWDPYGRVFDSQTLEPIPGASITLLKKRDNQTYTPLLPSEILGSAIDNPYLTKQDGRYSFVIPDSIYQLSVTAPNYTFPNNQAEINMNYSKAYSDLYPNATGRDIVQQGTIQHRDIPLDPKGQGVTYPVKLMQYFYNIDKATSKVSIEGVVSHPLTVIRFYSLKMIANSSAPTRYKLLTTIQADKFGNFKAGISQSQFEPNEFFGDVELVKTDLTIASQLQTNLIQKIFRFIFGKTLKVEAAQPVTTTIRLNPILSRIQGYAYDNSQHIMSNSSVGVYLTYANKPYSQTKTDQQGFYTMASDQLPDSSYTLKYSTVQGVPTSMSTSTFIAQNNTYLTKNKINLNVANTTTPSIPPKLEALVKPSTPAGRFTLPSSQPIQQVNLSQKITNSSSLMIFVVIILLVLLGGSGLLLGMYIIKKNQQGQSY